MKIAIAQLDQIVGDLQGNARRILDAWSDARRAARVSRSRRSSRSAAIRPRICSCDHRS